MLTHRHNKINEPKIGHFSIENCLKSFSLRKVARKRILRHTFRTFIDLLTHELKGTQTKSKLIEKFYRRWRKKFFFRVYCKGGRRKSFVASVWKIVELNERWKFEWNKFWILWIFESFLMKTLSRDFCRKVPFNIK
jgi:hypothetical protein